jgi:uncharacterized protein (TIGR02246 family)
MKRSSTVRMAIVAALATACTQQPATVPRPDAIEIQTALNARLSDFGSAIAAKDPVAVANMFTEDGSWILPDASRFTGRSNIETAARNYFGTIQSFITDRMAMDRLIVVSSSEAVTFSHADYTLTEPGNPPAKRVNPVADHWKKGSDGVWRVAYELNADGPAAAATTMR